MEQTGADVTEAKERVNDVLRAQYRPAQTAADATMFLSSAQIFALLDEHSPELVDRTQLRQVLLELGYREQLVSDEVMWLLQAA